MLRALLPPESANEAEIEKEKNAEKSESGGKSKAAGPTGKKRKADGAVEIPVAASRAAEEGEGEEEDAEGFTDDPTIPNVD